MCWRLASGRGRKAAVEAFSMKGRSNFFSSIVQCGPKYYKKASK
jgi:hypothetical protein